MASQEQLKTSHESLRTRILHLPLRAWAGWKQADRERSEFAEDLAPSLVNNAFARLTAADQNVISRFYLRRVDGDDTLMQELVTPQEVMRRLHSAHDALEELLCANVGLVVVTTNEEPIT